MTGEIKEKISHRKGEWIGIILKFIGFIKTFPFNRKK
jgi:hypothetical protein